MTMIYTTVHNTPNFTLLYRAQDATGMIINTETGKALSISESDVDDLWKRIRELTDSGETINNSLAILWVEFLGKIRGKQ
jgi:hypothetical protein